MTYDIVKDTSNITTISEKTLHKLLTKAIYCMTDATVDTLLAENDIVDLDIGIGILSIKLEKDTLLYKFTPSSELESAIKESVLNERNLLEDAFDSALVERVTNTYKDLI